MTSSDISCGLTHDSLEFGEEGYSVTDRQPSKMLSFIDVNNFSELDNRRKHLR